MREVNNDKPNSPYSFTEIQKPVQAQEESPAVQTPATPQKTENLKDLSAMPAATLGQSQVTSADSIGRDMKFLEKNPAVAAAIMQAVDNYAKTHTEEETLLFLEKAHQELVNKK